jgi:S1 RNA binding domain protein
MTLEVGAIVEGKVTGITKFGAFIELPGGKTGMVHISEVAATYVKEIRDFIQDNQMVRVKILAITPEGKVNLSIKRAIEQHRSAAAPRRAGPGDVAEFSRSSSGPQGFEEMLNRFKQASDDRMSDIRRNLDGKRGSYSSRKGHK